MINAMMSRRDFLKGSVATGAVLLANQCSIFQRVHQEEFSPEEIQSLTDLVSKYEYGRFNVIGKELSIKYNPNDGLVLIDQFYNFDQLSNQGDCVELMNSDYQELKQLHQDYFIIRAGGTEPDYFFYDKTNVFSYPLHFFLLLFKMDAMRSNDYLSWSDNSSEINSVLKRNPLISDPSFKKVCRLEESGYTVTKLINQEYPIHYSNSLMMDCRYNLPSLTSDQSWLDTVPLGMTSNNEIAYLSADEFSPGLFSIGFQPQRKKIDYYELNSAVVTEKCRGTPKLEAIINVLKKTKIIDTNENLYEAFSRTDCITIS